MSTPVRHHFVPQFYLAAWCTDRGKGDGERLWAVRNYGGQIKYLPRAPKAVGFQDHLYSFNKELPEALRAKLETDFFQPLDTYGSELVTKLRKNEHLSSSDRTLWAKFIVVMRMRTPANIALIKEIGRKVFVDKIGAGQEEYEKLREEGDPESVIEFVEGLRPGITNNFGLSNLPTLGEESIEKIERMVWHPLSFENGSHRLITSDTPCVFTTGIDHPNCVVALPLSPRHAFLAFYPDSPAQATLTRLGPTALAAALNKSVVSQAKQDAYCLSRGDAPLGFFRQFLPVT